MGYIEPKRGIIRRKSTKAETKAVPPLVGGWNARDPLSAMDPTDAVQLDNLTPMDGGVELRPGSSEHADTISGLYVESLMTYASPSATKQFAAATTAIWEITSSGAATSSLTGLTNGRWQHAMFTLPSISHLACVNNSADGLRYYNGSGWSTASLTGGISNTALANVCVHMNRLWLCEDNSLDVYYLDLQAITGAATKLETSSQFQRGGKVMAMASWTRDGGSGMDDVLAIISSNGEVLVYSGTDPEDATTWAKVGLFAIPRPIGRRCAIKFGGDIAILTVQGLIPMSEVLQRASSAQSAVAITDKIKGAFARAAGLYGSNHGWQIIEYPKRGLLIINVPVVERGTTHQYVMNTKTGAWCRWTGLDANVLGLSGDALYLGRSDGEVRVLDEAFDDVGIPIDGLAVHAYNTYGDPRVKRWLRFQPQMHKPEDYKPLVDLLINFSPDVPSYSPPQSISTGWTWDPPTAWEDLTWGLEIFSTFDWLSISGHAVAGALVVAVSADSPIQYNGGLVSYEAGGIY